MIKLSKYQIDIIQEIGKNKNIIVDSVAGSGKTTTVLYITKTYPEKNILMLTYNSKLKIETRNKILDMGLQNIEAHSYHAFCYKYYDVCSNDIEMDKIIENNFEPREQIEYDLIIIDEVQDITPLLFKLIRKIYNDMIFKSQLCLIGDKNQSIYNFAGADERYITLADKIFKYNDLEWSKLNLTQSFRVSIPVANFINHNMIGGQRIFSNKTGCQRPDYILCDTYDEDIVFHKIIKIIEVDGYKPEDIFILSYSVKTTSGGLTPIIKLENKIKDKTNYDVYVPISDEEYIDKDIIDGKLVFSTFHQSKGLERKFVFIYGFDSSYYEYYDKGAKQTECPNLLYVATTRASQKLFLLHDNNFDYLPFLNLNMIEQRTNFIDITYKDKKVKKVKKIKKEKSVTDLVNHLNYETIKRVMTKFKCHEIETIYDDFDLNIPIKTHQPNGKCEGVSELSGIAILNMYQYNITEKNDLYDHMKYMNEQIYKKSYKKKHPFIYKSIKNFKHKSYDINSYLKLANLWNSFKINLIYKIKQIKKYNWINEQQIQICLNRITNNLNISHDAKFELKKEYSICDFNIIGYIDCIDNDNIFEFKCVSKLKPEHFIQLALYAYLMESNKIIGKSYYLYNVLTNKLWNITYTYKDLKEMFWLLLNHEIKKLNDNEFIEKCLLKTVY